MKLEKEWVDLRGLKINPERVIKSLKILNKTEKEFLDFIEHDLPGYAVSVLEQMVTSYEWCKDYKNRQDPNVHSEKYRERVSKALNQQFNQ